MNMDNNLKTFETSFNATGMPRTKQVAVAAVLIAIGAVLRMFSPQIAGITPNFVIAMYCLSILLIRPKLGGALGIGLVAGAVAMMFSKSPIPYLNLITEPVGAIVCALVVRYLPEIALRGYSFKPIFCAILGTLASGTLYIFLNAKFALHLPPEQLMLAFKAPFIGVVLPVTAINAVLNQVLYLPAKQFLRI
ncbi:MAG TPA: tryptophan transporter [Negativicutes bacterium]|nr:tryptophan transporter [Negativicutes bacterium]